MAVVRTPDARFAALPDYPFAPHYVDVAAAVGRRGELRMHYLDEGTGEVVLCLHGEPSWSFLYRRMIPILARRARVVTPDLIGFGKSDKPTERSDYSYRMHRDALVALLDALDLRDITLVCQDWGGLLGLQIAGQLPDRFARLVIMNTFLPTGDIPASDGFKAWRAFAESTPDLPIETIFGQTIVDPDRKTPEILAGYVAPFPDASYKAGAQMFPLLVPIAPDDPGAAENRAAWTTLSAWRKPCLLLWGPHDPVLGVEAGHVMAQRIPSAAPPEVIEGAGHFLQEDRGEQVAERIVRFLDAG